MKQLNIVQVPVHNKKRFRFSYHGLDGKVKFITGKSFEVVNFQAQKKLNEIGFLKTSSSEIFLSEAWQQFYQKINNRKIAYINGKRVKPISESAIQDYTSFYLNHIIRKLGNIDLRLLDDAKMNDFVGYLDNNKNLDNSTKRKIYNLLSLIIQHQVNPPQSNLTKNICKDKDYMVDIEVVKPGFKPLIDFDIWTLDFMQNLIVQIPRPMERLICQIMLETACRPSEARALERKDLKFDQNQPMIFINKAVKRGKVVGNTKTENGMRMLSISVKLKGYIEDYLKNIPFDQDQLFLNSKGKYICIEQIIKHIDRVLAKNEVELPIKRKSYFFRHYMATYWAYTKKHKDNALELARDLGDQDINFVNENYIKRYKGLNNTEEKDKFQNEHFNWK